MTAWFESIAGPDYANALMWTIFALIGLLVLLVIIRIVRGLTFGTFVAGGKNRKARLAVMDATAVDSQRRLVLVRRDDIEHLILIGGPTDVVVEQNIRLLPPARRPAAEEVTAHAVAPPPPVPNPVAAAQPPVPRPAPRPAPALQTQPPVAPQPPPEPRIPAHIAAAPAPRTPPPSPAATPVDAPRAIQTPRPMMPVSPATPPPPADAPPVMPPARANLDQELLQELQVTLGADDRPSTADAKERSLDEEMSKLLGELSTRKS